MKEEPEIVKILKGEEKLGRLYIKSQCSYKQLKIPEETLHEISDKTNIFSESGLETNRNIRELYKILFETYAVAITLTDENERIISWNKYAEELLNMSKEDLFMKPVSSLYPPEEWEKIRSENVRQKGMQHSIETKILKKNNELIDVDLSLSVLKNHEEMVIGSIGVIKDITYQKWAEDALKESEKKFKKLYENAPIPYHTLSPTGEITSVNEKWCRTLGYTKKEVKGKLIFDFIEKTERGSAINSFKEKIQGKKSYAGGHERAFITKHGKERIFVIHDFLNFDKDKNVKSVHTTMEDITHRKRLWEKMVKSEEKYRVLAETSADGVFTTDVLGRLTYVNPSLESILGRRKSKLLTTPFRDYLSDSSVYLFQQAFLDVRKKERKMKNIGLDVIRNNGYEIPIEINITPLKKEGSFIGMECTVRDISERKRIERELKQSEKLRTEFMNIVAHELKSPITPIKGYLELIESDKDADEKIKNWAKIGLRNADRLMRLVNDILDVSRLDTDTMKFNMEKCDLTGVFDDITEDIKPDIENKNLKFIKEISENLPKILCDKYRLSQVLKNLLGNAIKFTDYGSIRLRVEEKEKHLFIYVEDTGVGISSGGTKKIFKKFYQAYTGEDRKNEGTGLGLFICKEIVKKHNGEIWAESKVGKGSKFTIKLPI